MHDSSTKQVIVSTQSKADLTKFSERIALFDESGTALQVHTEEELNSRYAPLARSWQASVFEDSLRPHSQYESPTMVWTDNMTTALSSPVVYKPAIVGGGSQVNDWNGLTSPTDSNILWSPGLFETFNGGSSDLEMHGELKGGVAGQEWVVVGEFDTNSTNSVIEIAFYASASVPLYPFLEVDGRPVSNVNLSAFTTTTADRKLTITFPFPAARRIRIWALNRVAEIRVPTGNSITKPTDTIRRRYAVLGDSLVNGSNAGGRGFPSGGSTAETHAAMLLRALVAQQPVLAGVGAQGYTTSSAFATVATSLATFSLNGAFIYGSVNDPQAGTGVQAAVESILSTLSAVPLRVVIGVPRAGWEACNVALAAAAAAAGVPFVQMDGFIYGSGSRVDPQTGGNAAYFMHSDGSHPTQAGHRAIAGYVFDQVSRLLD